MILIRPQSCAAGEVNIRISFGIHRQSDEYLFFKFQNGKYIDGANKIFGVFVP